MTNRRQKKILLCTITMFSIATTTPDLQGIVSIWIIGSSAAWIERRGNGNPKRGDEHDGCSWYIQDEKKITREKGEKTEEE